MTRGQRRYLVELGDREPHAIPRPSAWALVGMGLAQYWEPPTLHHAIAEALSHTRMLVISVLGEDELEKMAARATPTKGKE